MSCYIDSSIALGCSDGIGGIKKIYIVGGGEVTGFTYDANGAITGATSTTGTTLYGVELKRNTSSLTQNVQKSFENGTIFFEQVLTAILYKYSQDKRNKLKVLSQNDVQYLLGQVNGMYLSGGSAATGVAFGDRNGMEWIFTGQEHEPARVIVGALGTVFAGDTIDG
jgi:YD repeat-containing protein